MFEQWLSDVFSYPDWLTGFSIAGRTAVLYVFVVVGVRLLGTRELGRLNAYDFVLVVVIANAVQNALVGGDNSLVGGLVSASILLLMNLLFTWLLNRFPQLEKRVVGEPAVLVSEGSVQWERMKGEGVTRDELMAALREHGVTRLDDVRLAVLEVDGDISVVPRDSLVHRSRRRFRRVKTT
jgi:uncharacterized membrane protein YcaP (DUF421 family)